MSAAFAYLIKTLFEIYIGIVLLRLFLQWVRADFYNPISQFVVKATNPLLLPLRRVIPGLGGIDLAALVLAFLLALIEVTLLAGLPPLWQLGLTALVIVVTATFNLFFWAVVVRAVLSWVSPGAYNPASALLIQLTEPILAPIRRVIPPIGGLDLSTIVFLIGMQFLSILVHNALGF